MNGIYLICPVWGNYVSKMLELLIPCLLAPKNIPALVKRFRIILLVYAPAHDRATLEAHPAMQRLASLIEVGYVDFPGHAHGGTGMKIVHNLGIRRAWGDQWGLVPLCSDQFIADGWGEDIIACVKTGKRAIVQSGYSFPKEFADVVTSHRADNVITISPAEASQIYLTIGRQFNIPELVLEKPRTDFSWSLPDRTAFLRRTWYVSVNFAWPTRGPVQCGYSTDNDFLHLALDKLEDVVVMSSSIQHLVGGTASAPASATRDSAAWDTTKMRCSSEELIAITFKHVCNDWHRHWAGINFWCEGTEHSAAEKAPVELQAESAVAETFQVYHELMQGRGRPEVLEAERRRPN